IARTPSLPLPLLFIGIEAIEDQQRQENRQNPKNHPEKIERQACHKGVNPVTKNKQGKQNRQKQDHHHSGIPPLEASLLHPTSSLSLISNGAVYHRQIHPRFR